MRTVGHMAAAGGCAYERPPPSAATCLVGLDRVALREALAPLALPGFRLRQLWRWIYVCGARDFASMTDVSLATRERLDRSFTLARPQMVREECSVDGTRKWLFRFKDGGEAETVFIPEQERATLCLSSQIGCTLNCRFCHTGTQALARNLTGAEIVGQVLAARDLLSAWRPYPHPRAVTNIVFMGMGEPLYNYDNVAQAIRVLRDGEGLGLSRRRITLSTAGVAPLIPRCGRELGVRLAISLHAVEDSLRDILVPLNRKYPLAVLKSACRACPGASNAHRMTFEYVMLDGVNDSQSAARALAAWLKGLPAKVNLIPFNPWPGAPYRCSPPARCAAFAAVLNDAGLAAPVRAPRGRDILAACGQLRSETPRRRPMKAASLEAASGAEASLRVPDSAGEAVA